MAKKNIKIYTINEIIDYLYNNWDRQRALGGVLLPHEIGREGEDEVLDLLNKANADWEFQRTRASRTPADIVGVKNTPKTLYVSLVQVKKGNNDYVNRKNFEEIETLNNLKDILLRYTNSLDKLVSVCTGFVLVNADTGVVFSKFLRHYYRNLNNRNNPKQIHLRTIRRISSI